MPKRRPPNKSRPDWSRPLPELLVIPKVMTLRTLADVRTLLKHLPPETREKETWQHVADCLDKAARGSVDVIHVSIPLQIVMAMEGVECRVK
jgi:hypothetical protein